MYSYIIYVATDYNMLLDESEKAEMVEMGVLVFVRFIRFDLQYCE